MGPCGWDSHVDKITEHYSAISLDLAEDERPHSPKLVDEGGPTLRRPSDKRAPKLRGLHGTAFAAHFHSTSLQLCCQLMRHAVNPRAHSRTFSGRTYETHVLRGHVRALQRARKLAPPPSFISVQFNQCQFI